MKVKKLNKNVYGADLTAAEKNAMDKEIKRQLAEYDFKHKIEIQALILWQLHEQFSFGEKRLKRFYYNFDKALDNLLNRYKLNDKDAIWLCTLKLKEIGIDIESWNEEDK